jgi:hypothetical protein
MQKDKFIQIVDAIVEARVKKLVPILVDKKVAEIKKQLIKEISDGTAMIPDEIEIPDLENILNEDSILPKRKTAPISKPVEKTVTKNFTKDPKLNALLQQTAEEIRTGKIQPATDVNAMEQYKQLLAEQYKHAQESGEDMDTFEFNMDDIPAIMSKRVMALPSSGKIQDEIEKKIALEVGKKQIENMTGNKELGGIIMRDYRSLMKAVDAQAKSKRPQ